MTETKGTYNFGTTTKNDYHDQALRCCMTCQNCDKDIHGEFSFHCYIDAPKFANGIRPVKWNGICGSYSVNPAEVK